MMLQGGVVGGYSRQSSRVRKRKVSVPPGHLTTHQVALILGFSESRVRSLRTELDGRKVGNRLVYSRAAVRRMSAEMQREWPTKVPPPQAPKVLAAPATEIVTRRRRTRTSSSNGLLLALLPGIIWIVTLIWPSGSDDYQPAPSPAPTTSVQITPARPYVQADQPHARCSDGTLSYSVNRRGTCSHHGGVAVWLR